MLYEISLTGLPVLSKLLFALWMGRDKFERSTGPLKVAFRFADGTVKKCDFFSDDTTKVHSVIFIQIMYHLFEHLNIRFCTSISKSNNFEIATSCHR